MTNFRMSLAIIGFGITASAANAMDADFVKYWLDQYMSANTDEARSGVVMKGQVQKILPSDYIALKTRIRTMRTELPPSEVPKSIALQQIEIQLDQVVSTLDALPYSPADLSHDTCYKAALSRDCNNRLGGFAVAAWQSDNHHDCWPGIDGNYGEFVDGYLAWWSAHVDAKKATCIKPPAPARCNVAVCSKLFTSGIAFRPSAELGTTYGTGLGFNNGSFAAQLAGTVGVRAFTLSDAVDIHAALGIASSSATNDGKNVTPYMLIQAGIGVYNGLFAISYLHTTDPFHDFPAGSRSGDGISIYVDAAGVERVVKQ